MFSGMRIARGAGVFFGLCGWTECGEPANGQADRRVRVSFSRSGGGEDSFERESKDIRVKG